ncbi:MarR family winged helix-turn-helix transcriptional regulator [Polymorphum gilvum]|uniref:Probable transcriptional regulator n=1 Tax=Polymorphum gilvum (strain LMG 25793 / CGMCC 1.9160 / SL003B-26A1) TaxID=991905 RepID=F2J0G5_POLGS|nr:MarR family transcriptional regulator [Polymorphum gilvum]ADZ69633.1 Probable transcriptional regulator [Polymorphum gilvum SL003B-26A1]
MADINIRKASQTDAARRLAEAHAASDTPVPPYDLIELLFFAYRDFTSDPDTVLADFDFGRAHHRVLHFVDRNPGIRVTDLLGILRITKQSLGRVLKQLLDQGFIVQRPGEVDRRQRLLYTTEKGHALARRLSELQARRLDLAIKALPDRGSEIVRQFLFQMIDPDLRPEVARIIADKRRHRDAPARSGAGPAEEEATA